MIFEANLFILTCARHFKFSFAKSKTYCSSFFKELNEQDKKELPEYLSEFAHQPFIKTNKVTPNLLARIFASDGVYLYWINSSGCM